MIREQLERLRDAAEDAKTQALATANFQAGRLSALDEIIAIMDEPQLERDAEEAVKAPIAS